MIYKTIKRHKVGEKEVNYVKLMVLVSDKSFDTIHTNHVRQIKGQKHYVSVFKINYLFKCGNEK